MKLQHVCCKLIPPDSYWSQVKFLKGGFLTLQSHPPGQRWMNDQRPSVQDKNQSHQVWSQHEPPLSEASQPRQTIAQAGRWRGIELKKHKVQQRQANMHSRKALFPAPNAVLYSASHPHRLNSTLISSDPGIHVPWNTEAKQLQKIRP